MNTRINNIINRIRHHPSLLCIKNILNRSNCVYPESSHLRHYQMSAIDSEYYEMTIFYCKIVDKNRFIDYLIL